MKSLSRVASASVSAASTAVLRRRVSRSQPLLLLPSTHWGMHSRGCWPSSAESAGGSRRSNSSSSAVEELTAEANVMTKLVESRTHLGLMLPLPSRAGLVPIRVPITGTVRDLTQKIKQEDPSVKVRIESSAGYRFAAATPLRSLPRSDLFVMLDGGKGESPSRLRILRGEEVEASLSSELMDGDEQADVYELVRGAIISRGAGVISAQDFEQLCAKPGELPVADLSERTVAHFKEALRNEGLITIIQHGDIILLNPSSPAFRADVTQTLRRDDELLTEKAHILKEELNRLQAEDARLASIEQGIQDRASRSVKLKSAGVLSLMSAQFCFLAYLVYDVYSWDLMEPAIYTLTTTYTVLGSFYFSLKKRDPTYDNLMAISLAKSKSKLMPGLGYDPEEHVRIKDEIEKHRDAISLLESRRQQK